MTTAAPSTIWRQTVHQYIYQRDDLIYKDGTPHSKMKQFNMTRMATSFSTMTIAGLSAKLICKLSAHWKWRLVSKHL